jgi:ferredoxin
MGHLGHLKREYLDLARRLDNNYMRLPEPRTEAAWRGWQEILEILYRPEDAALAAQMPLRPTALARLAERLQMTEAEIEPRLNAMCERGIVMDLVHPVTHETRYLLAPPLGGFLEFSMMRATDHIPKQRLAHALEAYLLGDDTFAREMFDRETVIGRAVVHESALEKDTPEVLDWERATHILAEAEVKAVSLCYCRHTAEHLGKRCDAPLEICMSLGAGADFVIRRGFGRAIDTAEANDILEAARAARLVQIADNVKASPVYICNCCGCCCEQLQAINRFGLPAVTPSGFEPYADGTACKGCGKCARACPVAAITMHPSPGRARRHARLDPIIDRTRCLGCGVCVTACRNRAMRMRRRVQPPEVPATGLERVVRMATERGVLGELMFDDGSRGGAWLGRLLTVIEGLGPVQQAMAKKQIGSRFVRFALARKQGRKARLRANPE